MVGTLAAGGIGFTLWRKFRSAGKLVTRVSDIKLGFKDVDLKTMTANARLVLEVFNPSQATFGGDKLVGNLTMGDKDLGDVVMDKPFEIPPTSTTRLTIPLRLQLRSLGPKLIGVISQGITALFSGKQPKLDLQPVRLSGFYHSGPVQIPVETEFDFSIS